MQPRDPADQHWYDADEMKALIKRRVIGNRENVDYMCDIDAFALKGETFKQNLEQEREQRLLKQDNKIDTVVVELNLGNAHWVHVHFDFTKDQYKPAVTYVDPMGQEMPKIVRDTITNVYPNARIEVSAQKFQSDSHNCGPWTIAISESLVKTGKLPGNVNIETRREEDARFCRQERALTSAVTSSDAVVAETQIKEEDLLRYLAEPENKEASKAFDEAMQKKLEELYNKAPYAGEDKEKELIKQARDAAFEEVKQKLPDEIAKIERQFSAPRLR